MLIEAKLYKTEVLPFVGKKRKKQTCKELVSTVHLRRSCTFEIVSTLKSMFEEQGHTVDDVSDIEYELIK